MHRDVAPLVIGALIIIYGLFHTGTYNRLFARRGPPDNAPTLRGRVVLVAGGTVIFIFGLWSFFK